MRPALLLASLLALTIILPASAQQPDTAAVIDRAVASGDGRTAGTAYVVPGLLWEYAVLGRLNLRFRSQHTAQETAQGTAKDTATDVITVRDPKAGQIREVWFRAAPPDAPDQAETDRVVRIIMTSGDGMTPETAFVVGGRIGAEYQILSVMGVKATSQALLAIRGCSFDRLSGRDLDTEERRDVYFKLGNPNFDYRGECTLQPPSAAPAPPQAPTSAPRP